MSSSLDDTLIEAGLRGFSSQLYSAFPLRNFWEFHDEKQLNEKIFTLKESASKTFFEKICDRDSEEVFSLLMKLRVRMTEEVIANWMAKNEKHKIDSVSYLQKRAEMLCEDFQMALEDQLLLNPDMEMGSLKNYVHCQKVYAVNYFDGFWKPRNSHLNGERRVKMVKSLDAIGEEVLDKHKCFLERNSVDEGKIRVEEVKTILVRKSGQLKTYVDSHQGRVSRRYLKAELEDMKEYLLNGKGSTLRESGKDIYSKVIETLNNGIKFLAEEGAEGDAKSSEDFIHWVKELDSKLKSCCSNDGGIRDETQRIQQEEDDCSTSEQRSGITMQQIMKDKPFRAWDREELEQEARTHEDGSDDNLPGNKNKNCEEGDDEICPVKKSKESDRTEPTSATSKRTRLRRPRPTNSSVKNSEGSLAGTLDSPLPKKQRTVGNLLGKAITKTGSPVHRQRSRENDKTVISAPTKPPRRISRLEKTLSEHEHDMMKETFVDQVHTTYEPSSSSKDKEDQDTAITDILKDSSTSRPQSQSNNRDTDKKESDSGESSEIRCSNLTACPDQITILGGDPPSFKCDACKSVLTQKHSLNLHGKLCWNCWKARRQYKCDDCDKEFSRKADLVDHIRTHTDEKHTSGPTCDKRFTRNDSLLTNIRSHYASTVTTDMLHKDSSTSRPQSNNSETDKSESDSGESSELHRSNLNACPDQITILGGDPPTYKCDVCKMVFKKKGVKFHGKLCRKALRQYKCDHCGKVYCSKANLLIHIRSHTGEKPFKCPTCDKRCARNDSLLLHIRRAHTRKTRSFTCEKCQRIFSDRDGLNRHILNHEGKLPFGCSYCDQRRDTMLQLLAHVLTHSDERPYKCVTCDRPFGVKYRLVRHIQTVHRQPKEDADKQANDAGLEYLKEVTKNPNYDGDISSTAVLSHAVKKANLRIRDEIDSLSSAEATPPKSLGSDLSVRFDRINNLGEDPPTYKSDVCRTEIKKKRNLKHHEKKSGKKGHECHHCGKHFLWRSVLENHLRTHTREKPFKCPTCNKQFSRKDSLRLHTIRRHTQIGKRPFRCEKCGRSFDDQITLNRHVLKHQGKLPFGCSYCDKHFGTFAQLKDHVIIHCDERPYKCATCEIAFSWKQNLARHFQAIHNQSREDAIRLANEAAVDYLRKENHGSVDTISYSNIESVVMSHAIKKANLKLC